MQKTRTKNPSGTKMGHEYKNNKGLNQLDKVIYLNNYLILHNKVFYMDFPSSSQQKERTYGMSELQSGYSLVIKNVTENFTHLS